MHQATDPAIKKMKKLNKEFLKRASIQKAPKKLDFRNIWSRLWNQMLKVKVVVLIWVNRSRSRRQLAQKNEYLLKDMGLTRGDAQYEASKWFWEE